MRVYYIIYDIMHSSVIGMENNNTSYGYLVSNAILLIAMPDRYWDRIYML